MTKKVRAEVAGCRTASIRKKDVDVLKKRLNTSLVFGIKESSGAECMHTAIGCAQFEKQERVQEGRADVHGGGEMVEIDNHEAYHE